MQRHDKRPMIHSIAHNRNKAKNKRSYDIGSICSIVKYYCHPCFLHNSWWSFIKSSQPLFKSRYKQFTVGKRVSNQDHVYHFKLFTTDCIKWYPRPIEIWAMYWHAVCLASLHMYLSLQLASSLSWIDFLGDATQTYLLRLCYSSHLPFYHENLVVFFFIIMRI